MWCTDWRFFVAGSISAGLSHGYTTPLDVIKTRMQTNPELYNGSASLAVRKIIEDDGPMFLFQGLMPTLVGYGLEGALKFGTYEMCCVRVEGRPLWRQHPASRWLRRPTPRGLPAGASPSSRP